MWVTLWYMCNNCLGATKVRYVSSQNDYIFFIIDGAYSSYDECGTKPGHHVIVPFLNSSYKFRLAIILFWKNNWISYRYRQQTVFSLSSWLSIFQLVYGHGKTHTTHICRISMSDWNRRPLENNRLLASHPLDHGGDLYKWCAPIFYKLELLKY